LALSGGWALADHRRGRAGGAGRRARRAIALRRSGACRDNAMAARCFAARNAARVERHHRATRAAARTARFARIAVCSDRQRAHAALADRPPATFEAALLVLRCPAAQA